MSPATLAREARAEADRLAGTHTGNVLAALLCITFPSARPELTPPQRRLLDFIVAYRAEHQRSPSYSEMGRHAGVGSPATIWEHMEHLEEKGYITRRHGVGRSVRLVNWPEVEP